jgi:triacylglycerol esterase/lipase EstA (alpha/beta hydrolase family)
VVAEVLGTAVPWTGGQAQVGVHIFLRAWPPGRIRERQPEHLLVGHGFGCSSARWLIANSGAGARQTKLGGARVRSG